jgi:uncharacterized protein (DUF2267 family)
MLIPSIGGTAMSPVELKGIDHSVQLTHIWINAVEARLGWDNKPRAWRLLKSVLHGVRDWLPTNEAADFGAQLPTYLRGVFYEGWRPATTPVTERGKKSFIDRIAHDFRTDPLDDPEEAVAAVFDVITDRITAGEIADVRQSLPAELRALWDAPAKV